MVKSRQESLAPPEPEYTAPSEAELEAIERRVGQSDVNRTQAQNQILGHARAEAYRAQIEAAQVSQVVDNGPTYRDIAAESWPSVEERQRIAEASRRQFDELRQKRAVTTPPPKEMTGQQLIELLRDTGGQAKSESSEPSGDSETQ